MNRTLVALLVIAGQALADPALTPEQKQKLDTLQAMFQPGGTTNSGGYGLEKVEEFCGAAIPLDVDPSMVLYDDQDKTAARSAISSTCHGVAGAVVYLCGSEKDADPVVKQMVRDNVKRIVCKTTKNPADVSKTNYQAWSLEKGTLTFTCLADHSCGNLTENGMTFLRQNARSPTGLSIGGREMQQKILKQVGPENELHQRLADECGIVNLTVSVDEKLAEHFSHNTGHYGGGACDAGLQSVYNLCGRGDEFSELNKKAVKAATKKKFKGISCVYSETESIAIKPGGILELGASLNAPRPKYKGHTMMSIHDFYMRWLADNVKQWGK